MKFTDEDLNQWQTSLSGKGTSFEIERDEFEALLYRLECAEKYIDVSVCDWDINAEMKAAWIAWEESKGQNWGPNEPA